MKTNSFILVHYIIVASSLQYPAPIHRVWYCRVSTDDEEQLTSYEAQQTYYTDKIMTNPQWTMAGIFADDSGIL